MQAIDLKGKRILLTHADAFMGPALHAMFERCGAEVIAAEGSLSAPGEA